jgi:hypothetical protein
MDDGSFTVAISLGQNDQAHSIAGPDARQIKLEGLINYIQLIVVDNTPGEQKIVDFQEVRRKTSAEKSASFTVGGLSYGTDEGYSFLILMGHWERNTEGERSIGNLTEYSYNESENYKPTLLAAGLQTQVVQAGTTEVRVLMWPIVVDTKFTDSGGLSVSPDPTKLGEPVSLSQAESWTVNWTVQRGTVGLNGFDDLIRAQKVILGEDVQELVCGGVTGTMYLDRAGDPVATPSLSLSENTIAMDISDYLDGATDMATGDVAFKLTYIPFGLGAGSWTGFSRETALGAPEWIIRNGLNDEAQDGKTDFDDPYGTVAGVQKNGNGAVPFMVVLPDIARTFAQYYVRSGSTTTSENPWRGSEAYPFATINEALVQLEADYAANKNTSWMPSGSGKIDPAEIIVQGPLTVSGNSISIIDNSDPALKEYPPIILRNDPEAVGPAASATLKLGGTGSLIIVAGATVTLENIRAIALKKGSRNENRSR